MAEQFLSRLNEIEKKVEALGETLKRMITILTTVTEIKTELTVSREQILKAIQSQSVPEASLSEELAQLVVSEVRAAKDEILSLRSDVQPSGGSGGADTDQLAEMIKTEIGFLGKFLGEQIDAFKEEVQEMIKSMPPAPVSPPPTVEASSAAPVASAPTTPPATPAAASAAPSSLPLDRAMKVADQLDRIIASMKMGCVAGDVLEVMADAKSEIMKITPSDPIMVKIDKWVGVVASYSKRHQLQARDILKLKKEIREELPKYRPS
ncbi:MAG: hypothetical protein K9W43_04180 [Candidatus Thorarchaeota archaeon]|nr:hypothetical protein [Candidatus Thorarchaeota archaeon]